MTDEDLFPPYEDPSMDEPVEESPPLPPKEEYVFEEDFRELEMRRQRNIDGKYNCIPLSFKRFKKILPGFEKEMYITLTALEKVGKSKLADYLFVYSPLFDMIQGADFKIKVLYFTLEMSKQSKRLEFFAHLLWRLDRIHIDTKTLKSIEEGKPLDERILQLLRSPRYQRILKLYDESVTYIEDVKNPTGIFKLCKEYAQKNGTYTYSKTKKRSDGKPAVERFDWNDQDTYYIVILDNMANLSIEKGLSPYQNIIQMSKYLIEMRDHHHYLAVAIQHQSQSKENNESYKLGRMMASSDGLGDAKAVVRDCSLVIGLNSPFKLDMKECEHYDITKFKNYFRTMNIIDDRNYGAAGNICPLYFDGAVSEFRELPHYTETEKLRKVYAHIANLDNEIELESRISTAIRNISSTAFITFTREFNMKRLAEKGIFAYLRKALSRVFH